VRQLGQGQGHPGHPEGFWHSAPGGLIALMREIRATPLRSHARRLARRRRNERQRRPPVPGWIRALIEGPDHERQPWES